MPVKKEVFYRSVLSEGPMILLFLILAWAAWYLTLIFPSTLRFERLFDSLVLPIPLFALAPVVVFFFVLHRLGDNRYEIWNDHVRAISGLLSFKKDDTRIEYENIRGIEISRNLYGRIFNIGDLIIVSSAISGVEVVIDNVRDPSRYRDMILGAVKSGGFVPSGNHNTRTAIS